MAQKIFKRPLALALGAAFVATLAGTSIANAADNPFAMTELSSGYMVTDAAEGKCGGNKGAAKTDTEGKCGEGKCGGAKGAAKTDAEGKCGEGKCGGAKGTAKTDVEGKCGEGKCGGNK